VAIRACLFDVGGVLEITPATGFRHRWAARLLRESGEFERLLEELWSPGATGALTLEQIEHRTAQVLNLTRATVRDLMNDAWVEYLGTLNQELATFVRNLRPRYKTGIVSNSFVGAREREQDAYGFHELFDVIVYSHEVGYLKPDPRIYRLACEQLAVSPDDVVFVDDLDANVEAARAVGMTGIVFADNDQVLSELAELLR